MPSGQGAVKSAREIRTMKTILVEDNDRFRLSLEALLRSRFPSLRIEMAKDGKEALAKVRDFLPEIVFMDIRLPGQNGLKVTREIKTNYPDTTVIILTGFDLPEYREAAFDSGAAYFLSKESSSCQDICQVVESLMAQPRNVK
jgi:DNA-binding NarL/FixJ family response regulator